MNIVKLTEETRKNILENLLFMKSDRSWFLLRRSAPLIIKKMGTPMRPMSWNVLRKINSEGVFTGPKNMST